MTARLVVTGHDADGRSVFVRDDTVEPVDIPGIGRIWSYWSANEPAVYPGPGENPKSPEFFPPVGGVRFFSVAFAPHSGAKVEADSAGSDHWDDLAAVQEHADSVMHTTNSTDFALVTSGKLTLTLDDGERVQMSAGDGLVQNGTRHGWRVIGDEPATVTFVSVGAERR